MPIKVVDPTIALVIKSPVPINSVAELKKVIDEAIDQTVKTLKHPIQTIHITGNMNNADKVHKTK